MRFLLHAAKIPCVVPKNNAVERGATPALCALLEKPTVQTVRTLSPLENKQNDTKNAMKAWGQQCSPSCGCVVRFETNVDTETDTILDASYHAKTIMTTVVNGRLEPIRTERTQRPLVTDCKCKTLHELATVVSKSIESEKLSTVRNMTEFRGVRSSVSFRRAVLNHHELPRTDTHCFDLLEEAFLAMVRGHMPSPRRRTLNMERVMEENQNQQHESSPQTESDESGSSGSGYRYGMDRTSMSMSSSSSSSAMSALQLLDLDPELAYAGAPVSKHEYKDLLERQEQVENSHNDTAPRILDWESYVDEMTRAQEDAVEDAV